MLLRTSLVLLLAGCPKEPAATPDPAELASLGAGQGCADITLYRVSADGTLALVFSATETLTTDAFASGQTETASFDLASEGSLELWRGTGLQNYLCNDYLIGDESKDVVWTATSGTVDLAVTSTSQECLSYECSADAEIAISDAVLEAAGEEDVVIDAMSWTAGVGWLPG
jgi:hypothetical protein